MSAILLKVKAVLDVDQAVLIDNAFVLVEGQRIRSWGRQADLGTITPATEVLEYPDAICLPGLINCHVHLCLPSGGKPFYLRQTDQMALLTAVRNIQIELAAGVTTVRDCGDQNGVLFALRQAVSEGILFGPRLVLCGPPLTPDGGHAHFLGGVADGVQALSDQVQRRVDAGADFVKVIATGGGTPGTFPARATYRRDELRAVVDKAHGSDKPVAAHCRGIPGIRNAVVAGVDHIEHACFELPDGSLRFDPTVADQMATAGISVTPTIRLYHDALSFLQEELSHRELTTEETGYLQRLPRIIDEKYRALRGFLELGIHCVAGNDGGLPHTGFGCLWQEMTSMVDGGMTPMQAIIAATRQAAQCAGLSDTTGVIKAGKQADLILVEQDPTIDITALKDIRLVMLAGRIVKSS